jgi:UDP-N-acetylglucosamine diphosphorylase / glucose-1-phosphate thymidylyltransferase / UDP-N-acetylgalactosamine diphosphorylase / glucosamine-1-phosphate N-acetyltransferase / galactosamine-1-phosphate N-acetyltransferase
MRTELDDLVVVMPMAGRGQRFKDAGVTIPKPLIMVKGDPMVLRATSSLSFFARIPRRNIVAVVRVDDVENYRIGAELSKLFPGISVLVDENPQGATSTALVARNYFIPGTRALLMDCDIWFRSPIYEKLLLHPQAGLAGAIPVFAAEGDRWSFSAVDSNETIHQIVEKRRVNVPGCTLLANVGFYYFADALDFVHHAEAVLKKKLLDSECYLSYVIQEMIQAGRPFRAALCDQVIDMGTPDSHRKAEAFFDS